MAYHGLIEIIQGTQNIAENYTTVTANCYCVRDSGYAYSGYKTTVNCTLDGTTESKTLAGFDISASNPKILLGSFTKKVYHNADGTKTVSANFTWNSENSYVGTITGSASKILTTIPRASSVTATDANIGSASTININRASSNLTHTLTYSFSGLSGTIATKTSSTSVGWTVPTSFYQKIPNSSSGTVTITCDTYSGETKIGTKTTTMTISISENSKPVIDTATVIDTNATTVALTGSNKRLVSYKSTVKLDVSGRCLNYAGFSKLRENNINDISATKTTSGGTTTVTGTKTYINNTLTQFKICLVDTRNKVSNYKILNQANSSFVVVPYIPLTINAEFKRTTPTGGGISLKFAGNFYNGYYDANNTKFNTLVLKYRHRESGGTWSDWTNLVLNTDYSYGTGNTYSSTTISMGTGYNYKKKYEFQLSYADQLSSATFTQTVKEGEPNYDFGKDKNGNNYFNVNGDIYKDNKNIFNLIYPVGSIYMSANATDPKNLFGGTWERLKGGFLYGAANSYGIGNGIGTTTNPASGNTGSTALSINQIPSHKHTLLSRYGGGGTTGYGIITNSGDAITGNDNGGTSNCKDVSNAVANTGGGQGHTHSLNSHTHNIPYMAVFVWRRTA